RSLGEPEYLDPGLCSESEGGTVIQDAFEGLYQYGASHKVWPPGVAERHDLSEDGITYTFYLRRDAKWSDGVGVTAHDFEWSWKRVLDPVTASRYASILWFLEGGREYNEAPADQAPALREKVGVKALDDYTLQVRLVGPTPFFLQLTAFYSYAPVPRHVIEKHGDRWARPENIVSNGPFRVTEWQQNQRIVAVANPHYWDRATIPFDKVVFKITQEDDPAHNMFLAGETDYLDSKVPPSALPKYLREKEPLLSTTPYLGVYFYLINIKSPPFDDVRVRRALNLAIQKSSIGKYVIKGGQQEAWSIVHPGLEDLGYTKAQGDTFDPDKARELLAEAGYPDGKGFPRFQISYNTLEGHKLVAQFIQQEWKKYLGISCDLDNMEWKVLLKKQHEKDFQITRFAWIGDYLDPLTFLELFEGANPNNRCNFDDPEFNDLIHGSVREADPVKRFAMLKRAEAILCEQLPAIPIYYYVKQDMMHEWVEGYEHHLQGVHATRWFRVKG
ncbi:MAG: peptide ABC transporter substrate-binding protein, partial [Myxococcales bacterium]|nr:peptide ABC transporter substrate-binding protein [Myxococcales bacterium]